MPLPNLATSRGAGSRYTRFRGPVLVGFSTAEVASSEASGSAASPSYSFYNRNNAGLYAKTVTSSAGAPVDIRLALDGADHGVFTTDYFRLAGSTSVLTSATVGTVPFIVIPQTTVLLSSAATPADLGGGVALVWNRSSASDSEGTLWAFSTSSTGWMASTSAPWTTTYSTATA